MFEEFNSFTFFPAQPWSHSWERQHEIAYRIAKAIKKDVYILPPLGLVDYNIFSLEFIKKVINKGKLMRLKVNSNRILPNMKFVKSKYIHKFDSISTFVNFKVLSKKAKMNSNNFLWTTYVNPTVYEFIKRSKFSIIDIAERRQANNKLSSRIKELEKKAVSEASLVIVDNKITYEEYKDLTDRIYYIPQGYDNVQIRLSKDQYGKKVGYIGHLHNSIDYEYLFKLIEINNNMEFLIVGGILDETAQKLYEYKNVQMIGEVPKEELSKYLKEMKYGLIPYKLNEFTKGVFPTKLFEYLGAGVPVISTPIPEVSQFVNDKYIFLMDKPDKIKYSPNLQGIEGFLKENTWDSRFDKYLKCIEDVKK